MRYLILLVMLLCVPRIYAYTLPYPSYMPGHRLYKVSRIFDSLKSYWYWGTIAQSKYHRSLSDKYLVEAKTLFEYKQYLLAVDALNRSNEHIKTFSHEQMKIHRDVLEQLKQALPKEFLWQPEKQTSTLLPLHKLLDEAIKLRNE